MLHVSVSFQKRQHLLLVCSSLLYCIAVLADMARAYAQDCSLDALRVSDASRQCLVRLTAPIRRERPQVMLGRLPSKWRSTPNGVHLAENRGFVIARTSRDACPTADDPRGDREGPGSAAQLPGCVQRGWPKAGEAEYEGVSIHSLVTAIITEAVGFRQGTGPRSHIVAGCGSPETMASIHFSAKAQRLPLHPCHHSLPSFHATIGEGVNQ